MTLFTRFPFFSIQVMEKLNLVFWTFAYFKNWLSWFHFRLKLSKLFSTFANHMYPKKMTKIENILSIAFVSSTTIYGEGFASFRVPPFIHNVLI